MPVATIKSHMAECRPSLGSDMSNEAGTDTTGKSTPPPPASKQPIPTMTTAASLSAASATTDTTSTSANVVENASGWITTALAKAKEWMTSSATPSQPTSSNSKLSPSPSQLTSSGQATSSGKVAKKVVQLTSEQKKDIVDAVTRHLINPNTVAKKYGVQYYIVYNLIQSKGLKMPGR